MNKTCVHCRVEKSSDEFPKGYRRCKVCHKAAQDDWRRRNPEKNREYTLRSKYGLGVGQFDAALKVQHDACFICETPFRELRQVHVDHDPATGLKRGLLCGSCNRGIGQLKHSVRALERALGYLQAFEEFRDARSAS